MLYIESLSGKLASLNRAKKARIVRWGWRELNPRRPSQSVTGPRFRLNHSAKGVIIRFMKFATPEFMRDFMDPVA